MKITKELIDNILKKTQSPPRIAEWIEKYQNIEEKKLKIQKEQIKLEENYKKEKEGLRLDLQYLKQECDHPIFTFESDPSGNNDSYHECEICGKVW